jgi:hypothetical protein
MSTSANTLAREPKMMTKIVSDMMMVADRDGGFKWSAMELMAGPVDRNSRLARLLIQLCRAVRSESLESIRANPYEPGSDIQLSLPTVTSTRSSGHARFLRGATSSPTSPT